MRAAGRVPYLKNGVKYVKLNKLNKLKTHIE
jgi:hypothetical protein